MPRQLPEDIKHCWLNVVRRLQSCVRPHQCPGILTIRIIMDDRGIPVRWLTPTLTPLEPKNAPIEQVTALFPGEDL